MARIEKASTASGLTRRQEYELIRGALISERSSFDTQWRELADYLLPRRTRFFVTDKNKGDRRNLNIIDSTPRYAARTLQSGLHAGLTSPARPWLKLSVQDEALAQHPPVKAWLHEVTQRMLAVFLKSNLYNSLPTLYGDMGVFGTAAIGVLEDGRDLIRSYSYPIGSYAVGLDARGVASTFLRDFLPTVRQVVEEFGVIEGTRDIDWSRISVSTKNLWDKGNYDAPVEVTWIVTPNTRADRSKLEARHMPFHSCHFERGVEDGRFLRESGFRQMPILVPRWDVTGEDTYGTDCPGMTAIGDIKGLQIMHRRKAKAVDKALDPPLQGPSSLKTQQTSLLPGGITYVDGARDNSGLRPIHEVRLEGVREIREDIRDTQYRIQRAFYEDLFLMLANSDQGQPITAEEVRARHEEKLLALGPVLERTNDELLDPLVDRVFGVMQAAGAIPPPPEELENVDLRVEYISIMAQAQKLVGIGAHDRLLNSVGALAAVWPEAKHKVDVFEAIDTYGSMLGGNPKVIRSTEDAQAAMQQEQQAASAQAQATQLRDVAGAAASLGKTPMGTGSALDAVLDGMSA